MIPGKSGHRQVGRFGKCGSSTSGGTKHTQKGAGEQSHSHISGKLTCFVTNRPASLVIEQVKPRVTGARRVTRQPHACFCGGMLSTPSLLGNTDLGWAFPLLLPINCTCSRAHPPIPGCLSCLKMRQEDPGPVLPNARGFHQRKLD